MIKASDIFNMLKEKNKCEGIDTWIQVYLLEQFNSVMVANINEERVTKRQSWDKYKFIEEMKDRGFNVEYFCEDRPCGNCYFKISIPPQER